MEISLDLVVNVLRKSLIIILIFALIAGVGTYFFSEFYITPTYASTAKVNIIGKEDAQSLTETNNGFVFASRLVDTCTQILKSRNFLMAVKEAVGLDYTPDVSFSYVENTTVLIINAYDSDAETACEIAQAAMSLANEYIVEKTSAQVSIKEFEDPRVASNPTSPDPIKNAILAVVIISVIIFVIQLLREMFDTKIKDEEELVNRYNLPIMAAIPDFVDSHKHSSYYSTYSYSRGEK